MDTFYQWINKMSHKSDNNVSTHFSTFSLASNKTVTNLIRVGKSITRTTESAMIYEHYTACWWEWQIITTQHKNTLTV